MGRPPTPTHILELNGAFKNHPERKTARANEPKPTEKIGRPPSHLTLDQKLAWKELEAMVVPGLLTKTDRLVLEMIARLLVKLRDGTIKTQEVSILTTLIGKLGMSPADRAKVSVVANSKTDDPFDFLDN